MKNRKTKKMKEAVVNEGRNVLAFLALQEIVLPEWRKITFDILTDEEAILINNSNCE